MGILNTAKAHFANQKFQRSPLGQAIREHTRRYFYAGNTLAGLEEATKRQTIDSFWQQLVECQAADNPALALREKLTSYTLSAAGLMILALTEDEKAVMEYGKSPYISGTLHHHVKEAVPFNDDLKACVFQLGEKSTEELVGIANSRGAMHLYFANGFNMARIAIGDTRPPKDWYQPLMEAMLVWKEDVYREKLGLPRLTPAQLHAIPYSRYVDLVVLGESNPFQSWVETFPNLYLAGEGPRGI